MLIEPAKEVEPVPENKALPLVVMSPVAWIPLLTFNDPANELEPAVPCWINLPLMVSEPEAARVNNALPLVSVALKMLPVKEAEGRVEMLKTLPVVRLKAEMEATVPVVIPALILKMLALVIPDAEAIMLKTRPVVIWAEAITLKTLPVVRPLAEIEAIEPVA